MIIEISFGFVNAEFRREYVRDGFFGCGLPRRSGDRDHRFPPKSANRLRQGLQSEKRVHNWNEHRFLRGVEGRCPPTLNAADPLFRNYCRDCALLERLLDKIMSIEFFSTHCEEKLARLDCA